MLAISFGGVGGLLALCLGYSFLVAWPAAVFGAILGTFVHIDRD